MSKLQEALEEVQNTHIKEVDEMNAQLERQRDRTEELTEAVSTLIFFIFQSRLQFSGFKKSVSLPRLHAFLVQTKSTNSLSFFLLCPAKCARETNLATRVTEERPRRSTLEHACTPLTKSEVKEGLLAV